MKNILISLAALFIFASVASAQRYGERFDKYTPSQLDGAGSMSALSMAAALDDTTKEVDTRGYSYVGLLVTPSSDSVAVVVSYQGSRDGVTYGSFVTIDSLISRTTAVTEPKGFALPSAGLAFPFVRFRVDASTGAGGFGADPTPTINCEVIRRW